ncbi:5-oxoprolinase subunit PxpB [Rhizobium herbae]|uniref:KipI family sensor histidine kinase inhibitor n=1 Tax=Rhizobium herbae TaxID=508661 RepID=A0ABS4EJM1_9HYPH|nr:5-oxoprolinase subunit PxpB [Rhizobium herbae]MBP1858136.1 KipI family sensor histidine kinase inhibitor [Rhizobium herbae]
MTEVVSPRLSTEGAGAILLDAADTVFSDDIQSRIWAVAAWMLKVGGVAETVPGMNNLMIVFDPLAVAPDAIEHQLLQAWQTVVPNAIAGRDVDIPVVYGGATGEDLAVLAEHAGLSVDEVVRRHSEAVYSVAAVGAMPGFVYLSGLDPALAMPRRAVPRMKVEIGSVIIGGAQAGIMPCTAPSGWHVIGKTKVPLFDPLRDPPSACKPGDRIRFRVIEVQV